MAQNCVAETTCLNALSIKKGALPSGHAKKSFSLRLFLPFAGPSRSVYKTPHTSEKLFHHMSSRCCKVRECCFAQRTHVGNLNLQSLRATQKNRACTSRATLALCDSKKIPYTSRPLLSNSCTGRFCVFLLQALRLVLGAFLGEKMALLQYRARITFKSSARKKSTCEEKTVLKSPFRSRTNSSLSSNSFRASMSSRNCFAHGVDPCLPMHRCEHFALDLLRRSLGPLQVSLETVEHEFEVNLRFPETAEHAVRVPCRGDSRYLCWVKDIFRVSRLPECLTVVFEISSRTLTCRSPKPCLHRC